MTADYAMSLMAIQCDAGVLGYAAGWQQRGREMTAGIGIDVVKAIHWAVGIDDGGRVVLERAIDNNPGAIYTLIADLRRLEGKVVNGFDVV